MLWKMSKCVVNARIKRIQLSAFEILAHQLSILTHLYAYQQVICHMQDNDWRGRKILGPVHMSLFTGPAQ